MVRERNKYLVKAPGEHSGKKEGIPVQDKVRNLKSRLRRSSLILTCEPHLKRGTPCEVWPIQFEMTWGIWAFNDMLQAVVDVHSTPQSIG